MKKSVKTSTPIAPALTNTHGIFWDKLNQFFKTPATSLVERAKQRFTKDYESGFYFFSPRSCEIVFEFCFSLVQSVGAFDGDHLDLLPYQVFTIANLFGFYIQDSAGKIKRRFREAIISVPRKNGKSTFLAALALYGLFEERGAQIYLAAQSKEQAKILYKICADFAMSSRTIKKILGVHRGFNSSVIKFENRFILPIHANSRTLDGLNPSMVVYDEFFTTLSADLYNVLRTSLQARENPLFILTGSHAELINGFGYLYEHQKKEEFLRGADERTFFLVYEPDPSDDPHQLETWRKVNPAFGVIKTEDAFKSDYDQARLSDEAWVGFRAKNLNIWPTKKLSAWLPYDWAEKVQKIKTISPNQDCVIAIDLSFRRDLTAATICTMNKEMTWFFWVPETTLKERTRTEHPDWTKWVRQKKSYVCLGDYISVEKVWGDIKKFLTEKNLTPLLVGFDTFRAQDLKHILTQEGIEFFDFPQHRKKMSPAIRQFERALFERSIKIVPNPIAELCLSNAVLDVNDIGDLQLVKPVKRKEKMKIDGAITAVMAWSLYLRVALDEVANWEPVV